MFRLPPPAMRAAPLAVLALTLLLGACASRAPQQGAVERLSPAELARLAPPTNPRISLEDIVTLSREGFAPEAIVKRLAETGTVHALTPAQIVDLSRRGVDQRVIDHLVAAYENARQAALANELADRESRGAAQLARERAERLALEQWSWRYGYGWAPGFSFGWRRGYWGGPPYRPWGWGPRW